MLVRSSKYFDALVRMHDAETEAARASATALHASAQARQRKYEIERLRRELQESKDEYLHRLLFKNVIVHLTTEMSIEGVMAAVYGDSVVVRHARCQVTPTDIEQLDGDQVIPRIQVSWIQELMPKT